MATTPEEFYAGSFMVPAPPSPTIFADLPQTPESGSEVHFSLDDPVLPYISRVLMKDSNDEEFLYQCSEHSAVLQVQQTFSQIISSPSFDTNDNNTGMASVHLKRVYSCNAEVACSGYLQDNSSEQSTLTSLSMGAEAVGLFLKGMEEASLLLPKYSSFRKDCLVDQIFIEGSNHKGLKRTHDRDESLEELARTNKAMVMMLEPEEIVTQELYKEIMLNSYEIIIRDMEQLRIDMAKEVVKNKSKGAKKVVDDVVDLHTMLILCAQAVTANNRKSAGDLLKQIKKHASARGDATQRLAQYFAKGLEARLEGKGSLVYRSIMEKHPTSVEFLMAYKLYMAACCFNEVALIFSAEGILGAIKGKSRLHIVDFGINCGLHWPSLLRWVADREGGPPMVTITAVGCPQDISWPTEGIEETGCRLSDCARKFALQFKFHAITADWESVCIDDLNTDADDVLVVNDFFKFGTLVDESIFYDNPSPRDAVLNNIRQMRPHVFIQSVVNCSHGTSFSDRFRETMFYFTTLFGMFDATMPRESEPRLVLEQSVFGLSALNSIACEGVDLIHRPEKYKQWQARNRRAGLRQLPLTPDIAKKVRGKVMKCHHKDFLLGEDDQWLIQGWMGRVLFAHSTWVAEETPSVK